MRKSLVAGNWKMHGSVQSVERLCAGIVSGAGSLGDVDVLVCPPSVFIPSALQLMAGSAVAVGGQTVSEQAQGAYTGEIAADMLKGIGCQYVIVGHSERRALYAETNSVVADKFAAAEAVGLTPILCVGETLEQRDQGETLKVVGEQLQAVIHLVGVDKVAAAVVAYEPVWAIGTGVTATPEQAQEVHAAIRQQLTEAGNGTRILYGGSVKSSNAAEIFAQPDIDGALVGGASLDADEFLKICQQA
ncbi:triose-phosphate isomerase [Porticoccus sp. W117]|uniref:triose-phosphate isomerase n=1 Tax=Porticoccus sp. W117 TaxID=3054777 RepID=UPI0025960E69|nr:triose-phosphate isomerase [Porticoccus sp. W117]MDM3871296.1 triose-phosphate isomerase [Porticoccus sp. W117]